MTLAQAKTNNFDAEVRDRGSDGYLLIVSGPLFCRSWTIPAVLRSGRSGLDAIMEWVEGIAEEETDEGE